MYTPSPFYTCLNKRVHVDWITNRKFYKYVLLTEVKLPTAVKIALPRYFSIFWKSPNTEKFRVLSLSLFRITDVRQHQPVCVPIVAPGKKNVNDNSTKSSVICNNGVRNRDQNINLLVLYMFTTTAWYLTSQCWALSSSFDPHFVFRWRWSVT